MPQYVVTVDPVGDNGLIPIIVVSFKDGSGKKYLYFNPRRTNDFSKDELTYKSKWQELIKYIQTTVLVGQEVMVELPNEKDFMGYYWETVAQPQDSKYIHIPIQEIVLQNGTRIYDQFLLQK